MRSPLGFRGSCIVEDSLDPWLDQSAVADTGSNLAAGLRPPSRSTGLIDPLRDLDKRPDLPTDLWNVIRSDGTATIEPHCEEPGSMSSSDIGGEVVSNVPCLSSCDPELIQSFLERLRCWLGNSELTADDHGVD